MTGKPDMQYLFLILNFRHVLNVVFFLLSDSPVSEFYIPTFRNTVSSISIGLLNKKETYNDVRDGAFPKRQHR